MKLYLVQFILFLFLGYSQAKSQIVNLNDVSGTVLKEQNYLEFNGTSFFNDKWLKGEVVFEDGKNIKDIALKYDLVKDQLLFLGKNDDEYYFNNPVKEFSLTNEANKYLFRNGFPSIKSLNENSYYEVLSDLKVKLLKKNIKSISETKEFNSATVVRNVLDNITYYFFKNGELIPFRKDDIKNIAKLLDAEKSTQIVDFYLKSKLNIKKEDDLKKIVAFYNTIL